MQHPLFYGKTAHAIRFQTDLIGFVSQPFFLFHILFQIHPSQIRFSPAESISQYQLIQVQHGIDIGRFYPMSLGQFLDRQDAEGDIFCKMAGRKIGG